LHEFNKINFLWLIRRLINLASFDERNVLNFRLKQASMNFSQTFLSLQKLWLRVQGVRSLPSFFQTGYTWSLANESVCISKYARECKTFYAEIYYVLWRQGTLQFWGATANQRQGPYRLANQKEGDYPTIQFKFNEFIEAINRKRKVQGTEKTRMGVF
jgi:hypothetical protein